MVRKGTPGIMPASPQDVPSGTESLYLHLKERNPQKIGEFGNITVADLLFININPASPYPQRQAHLPSIR